MGTGPKLVIDLTQPRQIAIVGRGRLGTALARRLTDTGHEVVGPLARDYAAEALHGIRVVLLCVPDREIAAAAEALSERVPLDGRCPFVGHCSGAGSLSRLAPLPREARFGLHPLMTFAPGTDRHWDGATAAAAVAAIAEPALKLASDLARALGLHPFAIDEADRGAYHAAASMASNFLITLLAAAERLGESAGVQREALLPLVRATVENWASDGAAALTGPIARGDTETVARQREALEQRTPQLLELFDVLAQATRELAAAPVAA
jgi:predicted short-subunit dehydrogenase-like oxidoreductase (DUF2520 family)